MINAADPQAADLGRCNDEFVNLVIVHFSDRVVKSRTLEHDLSPTPGGHDIDVRFIEARWRAGRKQEALARNQSDELRSSDPRRPETVAGTDLPDGPASGRIGGICRATRRPAAGA